MFNHSRHGTPARSTKGTHVRRVIVAVAFATALPLAFATPSFAFTVRSFTARNATIQSQRPEGSCVYQVKYDFLPDPYNSLVATPFPSSYSLDVSVAAPIVSAMNLTSARDQQWVTYQAQLVDLTTGQITYGPWMPNRLVSDDSLTLLPGGSHFTFALKSISAPTHTYRARVAIWWARGGVWTNNAVLDLDNLSTLGHPFISNGSPTSSCTF